MLLSIIIPVYNIEKYIGPCILSVVNQDLESSQYEIIIVNDGSTDKSPIIVKEFSQKYSNIIIHTQDNIGLGGARKSGLKLAQGEFIYFLDGDDYLARKTLGRVVKEIKSNNLDILGFKFLKTKKLDLTDSKKQNIFEVKDSITNGINFIASNKNYRVEVWWYVIKKEFLLKTNLTFEDKRFVNDSYFTPSLFIKAKRVGFLNMDIYRYVQRPGSITSNKNLRHYEKHIKDLEFAIHQMDNIIADIKEKQPDSSAIDIIKIKQESYVLFAFIRFLKSDLKYAYFNKILNGFQNINAYPIKNLTKGSEYSNFMYFLLVYILNNKNILIPSVVVAKFYFKLKRKIFV